MLDRKIIKVDRKLIKKLVLILYRLKVTKF